MTPRESNTPRRPRRDKYISRAWACQRRKSKCSGHDPCISCQGRDLICTYSTEKRRPRRPNLNVQRRAPARRAVSVDKERDSSTRDPLDVELSANYLDSIVDGREAGSPSDQSVHTNTSPSHSSAKTSLYRCVGYDPNRMSLRSQISEARALFKAGGSSESDREEIYDRGETYPVELPTFAEIEDSLHVYFENTARQYPAIHSASTVSRIHETLHCLKYPSSGLKVDVDHTAAPTVALLCIIIAISKITGNNTSPSNTDRSITLKNHARNLLQTFEFRPPNLEVLRCHALITIYLLHMDFLDLALQSIAVTVQIAMTLQLHRQSQSPRNESDSYDQNLWWTIYILDRSISCLGGTPYLIRDEEIDAPRLASDAHSQKFSLVTYMNHSSQLDRHNESEERSFHRETTYLEILAHLGRFWARIWNDLFSDNSQPDCQWQATEFLDAQIRIFQQRLPPELTWQSSSSMGRDLEKEEEITMQRQLVVLMRVNTLRLLIRRNPASKCTCLDQKNPQIDGATISAQIIKAIASLGARHEYLIPIGHIVSITLVQCILYLVNVIGESTITSGTDIASSSVVSAYRILIDLSAHCLSARNAVETLDAAFFRENDASTRPHAPPSTIGTLPQRSGSSELVEREDAHTNGLGHTEKRNSASISTKQTPRPNDLFACLQRSYETLDSLIPNALPKP